MGGLGNKPHGFIDEMEIANRTGLQLIVDSERDRFGSNLRRSPKIHQNLPDKLRESVSFEDGSLLKMKYGYSDVGIARCAPWNSDPRTL